MLGHKSSVRPMKKAAYEAGAKEAIATELCQGWTKRWAIGWTFQEGLNLRENVKPTKQVRRRISCSGCSAAARSGGRDTLLCPLGRS